MSTFSGKYKKGVSRNIFENLFSVMVPVYNSELTLKELFERIHNVLLLNPILFEIILVNDGSDDYSWEVIKDFSEKHSHIKVLI